MIDRFSRANFVLFLTINNKSQYWILVKASHFYGHAHSITFRLFERHILIFVWNEKMPLIYDLAHSMGSHLMSFNVFLFFFFFLHTLNILSEKQKNMVFKQTHAPRDVIMIMILTIFNSKQILKYPGCLLTDLFQPIFIRWSFSLMIAGCCFYILLSHRFFTLLCFALKFSNNKNEWVFMSFVFSHFIRISLHKTWIFSEFKRTREEQNTLQFNTHRYTYYIEFILTAHKTEYNIAPKTHKTKLHICTLACNIKTPIDSVKIKKNSHQRNKASTILFVVFIFCVPFLLFFFTQYNK